jgi:8-oxo-dGTP pyrophosphatase MutT (NUDIX family)
VRGMTREEQQRLITLPFDQLWEDLWGPPTEGSNPYKHEKEQSRTKLDALKQASPSLAEIIATVNHAWETPEWGFPKGRRDAHETEYACALRELWEETAISEKEIIPIKNLEPIKETFFGSNHIQYCHKYYIMYMQDEKDALYDPTNEHMRREIGNLKWCTLEEGLEKIRPDNVEKREILLRVSNLLRNYCPLRYQA